MNISYFDNPQAIKLIVYEIINKGIAESAQFVNYFVQTVQ